jgi:hypothetical protein
MGLNLQLILTYKKHDAEIQSNSRFLAQKIGNNKNHTVTTNSGPARHFLFDGIYIKIMKSNKAFKKILIIVGIRLADLRVKKGYSTIKEFVQRYDLPEIQYWRIEKGKANITFKSLVKILSIHNVSLQDFFCSVNEHVV